MATDNILQGTLNTAQTGPNLPPIPQGLKIPDSTGNAKTDIQQLQAVQQQPSMLLNFQKVMASTAKQAYNDRQSNELNTLGFDPTKVSGGTFSNIIGNLEQNRGMDVSKIYGTTMGTYNLVQQQITDRLEKAQELEENRRQFEEQMKLKKAELKMLKKSNAQSYKTAKLDYEIKKKNFDLDYAAALKKINTANVASQIYAEQDANRKLFDQQKLASGNYYKVGDQLYETKWK